MLVVDEAAPVVDVPASKEVSAQTASESPVANTQENLEKGSTPEVSNPNLQVYQDVLAKHKADPNYQMTDSEVDAYLAIQEEINSGRMKDPGPKAEVKKEDVKPETKTEEPATEKATENEPNPGEKIQGIPEEVSENILAAMKKVGAKDMAELPDKIDGLLKQMSTSGGRLGSELASAKQAMEELLVEKRSHMRWLEDLKAGKKEAFDYLKNFVSDTSVLAPAATKQSTAQVGDVDTSEFLDDKLAPLVLSQKKQIEELTKMVEKLSNTEKVRQEAHQKTEVVSSWVDSIVELVTNNQTDFGLTPSEARGLAQKYWGPDGHLQPIHPKFDAIHKLIVYANEKGLPDLQTAHIVSQHENGRFAQKIIEATKQGQKAVQHTPAPNDALSQQQGRSKTTDIAPHIDESAVESMERGDFNSIPDDWMDENGNLIPSKVPIRFHEKAFGRRGVSPK